MRCRVDLSGANPASTDLRRVRHVIVSARRFEQIVGDALDALPESMARVLDNVAVIVEDEPTPEQCAQHGDLLGLYEGDGSHGAGPLLGPFVAAPLTLPARVTLFRKPLCAICTDEDELFDQVYDTLVHEFAHHFGIDDDRLDELGWG
jgi:predicted Zn-dependent protease with MMP-like domain